MPKYIKGDDLFTYIVTVSFNDIEYWYIVNADNEANATEEALSLAAQDLFVVDIFDYSGTVEFHADSESEKEYVFDYDFPDDENAAIDMLLERAAADLKIVNIEQV